jgi:hypothetical protein
MVGSKAPLGSLESRPDAQLLRMELWPTRPIHRLPRGRRGSLLREKGEFGESSTGKDMAEVDGNPLLVADGFEGQPGAGMPTWTEWRAVNSLLFVRFRISRSADIQLSAPLVAMIEISPTASCTRSIHLARMQPWENGNTECAGVQGGVNWSNGNSLLAG